MRAAATGVAENHEGKDRGTSGYALGVQECVQHLLHKVVN